MRSLLIDDVRNIPADKVARTYWEAIEALEDEIWDLVYLDHDLNSFDENGKEFTGKDICTWLQANQQAHPRRVILVTMNYWGGKDMLAILNRLGVNCSWNRGG